MRFIIIAVIGLACFGIGEHIGKWSIIDKWAASAAATRAARLDCWHRTRSETCIEADVFISHTYTQF